MPCRRPAVRAPACLPLLFNTLLVLIVTPTFYYAWENRREKAKARGKKA